MENIPVYDNRDSEKGQNVILVALLMMVLIGMLSLVLDGGFSYASRRSAQNAADAGALAGANVLCGIQSGDAYDTAWEYAVTRNQAVDADIAIDDTVQVTATVTHDSFFAGLIGHEVVTVTAFAEAGCYNPCGAAVLPVAWACSPPAGGSLEDDCNIITGTVDAPGPLYLVMDSEKAEEDYVCQDPPNSGEPAGTLDCDIDDDGIDDLIGGGGRSWLNLDGGSGDANELVSWLEQRITVPLDIHTWLGGISGVSTSVFRAAEWLAIEHPVVILPVFNDYTVDCDPEPITSPCHNQWHTGLDSERHSNATSQDYYHVISFSPFIVTGVSTGNNACEGVCTAKDWLVTLGWLTEHAKTIEGYFISGYEDGMSGKCDNYGGAVTIYLDH